MNIGERLSFEGSYFTDNNGSRKNLELYFPTDEELEAQLDDSLWHNPEDSLELIKQLLKNNHHESTPTMHRLVLKALAIPVFTREFEGEEVTADTEAAVLDMAQMGSSILDRQLALYSEKATTEHTVLDQAINDAVIMQLVSRSFRSAEDDDIILLPVSPSDYNELPHANFTVLRRHQLGRAHLVVDERMPKLHTQDPHVNQQRILIKPSEILGETPMDQFAEILVAEYHDEQGIDATEIALIESATDRLFAKINAHFDHIQPRS